MNKKTKTKKRKKHRSYKETLKKLAKKLNFDLAVDRIIGDSKSDFIINAVDIEILRKKRTEFINMCKKEIEQGRYRPSPLILIDVPKKDFTLRPGATCDLKDRLIFQSLVDYISEKIENKLLQKNIVFGYRLDNGSKKKMYISPRKAYKRFLDYQRQLCKQKKIKYILIADVAAYFERIYHHVLENNLSNMGCDSDAVFCIKEILREWYSGVSYGIPQGMFTSDALGNVYLHTVDREMISNGFRYLRYVDDIKIFCKDLMEARKSLCVLVKALRDIGLNLQSAKTRSYRKKHYIKCHLSPLTGEIDKLKEQHKIKIRPFSLYAQEDLWGYVDLFGEIEGGEEEDSGEDKIEAFKKSFSSKKRKNSGELIEYLKIFSSLKSNFLQNFILKNWDIWPHLTHYFINYLKIFSPKRKIINNIIKFLNSSKNIYQWQEMWLLQYFFVASKKLIIDEDIEIFKSFFRDRNKHDASRCTAALLIGKFGDFSDWRLLKNSYKQESSQWVKRAIIVATRKLSKDERNHFYSYCKKEDPFIRLVVEYVQGR